MTDKLFLRCCTAAHSLQRRVHKTSLLLSECYFYRQINKFEQKFQEYIYIEKVASVYLK